MYYICFCFIACCILYFMFAMVFIKRDVVFTAYFIEFYVYNAGVNANS